MHILLTLHQGATAAQARAALKQYKDVMQAAERIFDGAFDDVVDEPEASPPHSKKAESSRKSRMIVCTFNHSCLPYSHTCLQTPEEEDEGDEDMEDAEDDYGDEYSRSLVVHDLHAVSQGRLINSGLRLRL